MKLSSIAVFAAPPTGYFVLKGCNEYFEVLVSFWVAFPISQHKCLIHVVAAHAKLLHYNQLL